MGDTGWKSRHFLSVWEDYSHGPCFEARAVVKGCWDEQEEQDLHGLGAWAVQQGLACRGGCTVLMAGLNW